MTAGPRPGAETTENRYVCDAWNRLVKVATSADATIADSHYDGLGRRICKTLASGKTCTFHTLPLSPPF